MRCRSLNCCRGARRRAPAFDTNAATPLGLVRLKTNGSGVSHSGATGVIATKLLWPWRRRSFFRFPLSTFRLLPVLGSRRRATLLLLLRLAVRALTTFSLAARFTRGSGTSGRVDRLMTSRRRTSCATLLVFTCAGRRRCAESLTLRCSLAPLWRNLPWFALLRTWLLAQSSRRRPSMLWLRRRAL